MAVSFDVSLVLVGDNVIAQVCESDLDCDSLLVVLSETNTEDVPKRETIVHECEREVVIDVSVIVNSFFVNVAVTVKVCNSLVRDFDTVSVSLAHALVVREVVVVAELGVVGVIGIVIETVGVTAVVSVPLRV